MEIYVNMYVYNLLIWTPYKENGTLFQLDNLRGAIDLRLI